MEKKQAGAGYLLVFFENIENLNNAYINFTNLWINIKEKYGIKEDQIPEDIRLDEEDKVALESAREELRATIIQTYLKYNAIKGMVPDLSVDENLVRKVYDLARQKLAIANRDKIAEYVEEMNKIFASSVLSDLLIQARDLYGQITG